MAGTSEGGILQTINPINVLRALFKRLVRNTLSEYIYYALLDSLGFEDSFKYVKLQPHLQMDFKNITTPLKVAIIGGGMSGAAAAYWLSLIGKGNIEIHIFEKGKIGGRVCTAIFCGSEYEMGGAIMHEANAFAVNFSKLVGLKLKPAKDDSKCLVVKSIDDYSKGVNSESNIVFHEKGSAFYSKLRVMCRYGMLPLFRFSNKINDMLSRFKGLYPLLANGACFSHPQDLLAAVVSDSSVLLADNNCGDKENGPNFANEFGQAAARCNYGQTNLPEFTFLVSAAGSQMEKLFSVIGGNRRIASELVTASQAQVKQLNVTEINRSNKSQNQWTLNCADGECTTSYDSVIIANPFERSEIEIDGEPVNSLKDEGVDFQRVHVTFIKGVLKQRGIANIFACGSKRGLPLGVIHSVGILVPVDVSESEGKTMVAQAMQGREAVWKVFSTQSLVGSDEPHALLSPLFESISHIEQVSEFYAYPEYKPSGGSPLSYQHSFYPFVNTAGGGVFSTCGIERTASAIEMALISGQNAALLVRQHLLTIQRNLKK